MDLLTTLFLHPFINLLFFLYKIFGENMGLAIIALTILFKFVTLPLNLRMLRSQRRMNQLKPQLDQLKEQHGQDKMALAQAQMDLYKAEGVSPTGACLPLLLQFPFLIGLFQAFRFIVDNHTVAELNHILYHNWLHLSEVGDKLVSEVIDLHFFGINLAQPDNPWIVPGSLLLLPILAALSQFILSKMSMPPKTILPQPNNKQEASLESSMVAAQSQMVYLFPIVTFVINLQFPAALALYWTVGNIFSIIQQIYINRTMPILALNQQGELVPASELQSPVIEAEIVSESKATKKAKPKKKKRK